MTVEAGQVTRVREATASRKAVVDPRLRTRGVQGLLVAGASVLPVIPAVNINAAVIAIAERPGRPDRRPGAI